MQTQDRQGLQGDLRRLGRALEERTDDLIAEITARAQRRRAKEGVPVLNPAVEKSFEGLGALATAAVARWLAGEPVGVASAAGEEFSRVFAQLTASSDVPLSEVVRRCSYWRERCQLALREAAEPADLGGTEALGWACAAIQEAADRAIVQMSSIFDGERRRVNEELAARQAELSFLATHDGLTGLANRSLIVESLERMLARSAREGSAVTVFFIDLDDFKLVNDTLSHRAGDQLLIAVAGRLREAVRDADTVGRLGGDEFVILTECSAAGEDPGEIATRICEALVTPFALAGQPGPLQASASIGVAVAAAGSSAEQLLCDADVAMYGAKSRGGGCARFEPGMQEALAGYGRSRVAPRRAT